MDFSDRKKTAFTLPSHVHSGITRIGCNEKLSEGLIFRPELLVDELIPFEDMIVAVGVAVVRVPPGCLGRTGSLVYSMTS